MPVITTRRFTAHPLPETNIRFPIAHFQFPIFETSSKTLDATYSSKEHRGGERSVKYDTHIAEVKGINWQLEIGNWKSKVRSLPDTRKSDTLPYNRAFSETEQQLAYEDLRDWMAALESAGELKTIRTLVNPSLRSQRSRIGSPKSGGPALLFQNVEGHPGSQVLINQFGSARRMNLALEVNSLDQVADRNPSFHGCEIPARLPRQSQDAPMLAGNGQVLPQNSFHGPCKEVIKRDHYSLLDFPILQCWPKDAGRFITMPCVITRDPKTGKRNVGMYRLQVYDERTTGMHWQRQKIGAEHYREALRTAAATGHVGTSALAHRRARTLRAQQ